MKIGIVTISFNQKAFLGEAISSVTATTARNRLKYVVVDPGSSDGSREIIKARGSEIDTVILDPDDGPSDGLNKGFRECGDCDILGYINSDDRLAHGAVEWVLSYFQEHKSTDVILGAVRIIDEDGNRSLRSRVCDTFDLGRFAIGACNVFQQGTFFTRAALEQTNGFNSLNRTCWDSELIVDLKLAGANIQTSSKILGEFRIHRESITGSGRMQSKYLEDRARIRAKIESAGVPTCPQLRAYALRALHRVNPARHASYLLAQ